MIGELYMRNGDGMVSRDESLVLMGVSRSMQVCFLAVRRSNKSKYVHVEERR
jgi:hypothetical protein